MKSTIIFLATLFLVSNAGAASIYHCYNKVENLYGPMIMRVDSSKGTVTFRHQLESLNTFPFPAQFDVSFRDACKETADEAQYYGARGPVSYKGQLCIYKKYLGAIGGMHVLAIDEANWRNGKVNLFLSDTSVYNYYRAYECTKIGESR